MDLAIRQRPRVGLMLVLLAAAMPVRIADQFGVVNSVSILDLILIGAAAALYGHAMLSRQVNMGDVRLFRLLCVPLVISLVSFAWSQDQAATTRAILIYAEGVIAYLFVVWQLQDATPDRVLTYMKRYVYLVILPGILLLLHFPGFAPEEQGISPTSNDYVGYFTRLSHPVLGRSNNLATVLAFFIPVLLYWGVRHHNRRFSRAALIGLIAVFLTLSRGVILALVICGGLYLLSGLQRRSASPGHGWLMVRGVVASILLVGGTFLLLYEANPETGQSFTASRLSLVNINDRLHLASLGINKVFLHPLLGYGAGVTADNDPLLQSVHNTYLQQLIYFGIPLGAVVCASLLGIAVFFFRRRPRTGLSRILGYSIVVQLLIFTFEASFEGTVLRVLFYMSVGLAIALLRSAEAQDETLTPSDETLAPSDSVAREEGSIPMLLSSGSSSRRPPLR